MLIQGCAGLHESDRSPDILVVGAGTLGIVLAVALARHGQKVTLVEAGPADPESDFRRRNEGVSGGRPHLGLKEGRMSALGGTTRLWGGQLTAFSPADFERSINGSLSWPISYNEISTYVSRVYTFLNEASGGHVSDPALQGLADVPRPGPNLEVSRHLWLPIADFSYLFRQAIEGLDNLTVITDTEARSLRFEGHRVAAVTARSPDGTRVTFTPKHVVLANGTFELVRLLLRAAATDPLCPFRENANIGRGYIDHLHGIAGVLKPTDITRLRMAFETRYKNGVKLTTKIRASDQFVQGHNAANCAASILGGGSLSQHGRDAVSLVRRILRSPSGSGFAQFIRQCGVMARTLIPMAWNYFVWMRSYHLTGKEFWVGLEVEQFPTAKSRLSLAPDAPPADAQIFLNWDIDGREIASVREFCLHFRDYIHEAGLGTLEIDERILAADPAFFDDCHDGFHQMGGARMAMTEADGVVDSNLKVFGTDNLWALGAAVFPTGSFANPTLTALALALRLSDTLSKVVNPSPAERRDA